MRKLFVAIVVGVCLWFIAGHSLQVYAQVVATSFQQPLQPTSQYRADQDHAEYNSTYRQWHVGEDWNRGSCNDDFGDAVYAAANGRVTYAQYAGGGWGNVIIIRHLLPSGAKINSSYGHLSSMAVWVGKDVSKGEFIGNVGNADGRYCAHLHFEIRVDPSLEQNPGSGYGVWVETIWIKTTDPSGFISTHK